MEKLIKSSAFALLIFSAATAHSQSNLWIAIAQQKGMDIFCKANYVPGTIPNLRPQNQDQRFGLYLRCEAKGGRDEMIKNSCCEHLSANDAKNIGVCPDNPVNIVVPIRDAFKLAVHC